MPRASTSEDVLDRAKVVPAKVLKREVGIKGTKQELIKALHGKDPKRLEALTDYYELKSERSFFVFRMKGRSRVDFGDLGDARRILESKIEENRQEGEPKYKILRISRPKEDGELILQVTYQKPEHTDHEIDGVVHRHRDTKTATVGLNLDDNYAVVHTRSGKKALECMGTLAKAVIGSTGAAEPVVPAVQDQERKFGRVRAHSVLIENLTLPGTRQVQLRGEDVRRTIKVLKDDYELDFEKMGARFHFEGTETAKQVRFAGDGRLILPLKSMDRDKVIRKLLE